MSYSKQLKYCCCHRRRAERTAAGIFLGLSLLLAACTTERSWDVRGRVVGFGADARTVFIAHENIPGLMPAMTMPFTADPLELRGVEMGDGIAFTLYANTDSSWISDLRPLEPDAPPLVLEDAPASPTRADAMLQQGEVVPDVTLVNADGESFALADFRGKFVLVNFIYTRCPLPDFCPWMTRRFATLHDLLQSEYRDDVALLSVTVDPEYDTPDVVGAYVERFDPSFIGLTGTNSQVAAAAKAFFVGYGGAGVDLVHTEYVAVLDREGRMRYVYGSDVVRTLATDVPRLLAEL